jgi:hypothetical protein
MAMPYRHTQRGTLTIILCLAFAAFDAAIVWRSGQWPAAAVAVVLVAVALVFSSLTVEVGDNELRWFFGPGFWSYRLPLDDIETVAAVRNRWWNGFGIRRGPRFPALQRIGAGCRRTAPEIARSPPHRHRRSARPDGGVEIGGTRALRGWRSCARSGI